MTEESGFDIIVIGAGIAGASVAAELAQYARVLLLEMESQPGYHTTGRSAAVYAPIYGPQPIRALTRASREFFLAPPEGFADHPLLSERGGLFVASADQLPMLDGAFAELGKEGPLEPLDAAGVRALQPLLRPDYVAGGFHDPSCFDIDVHALHQGYLRLFRKSGGTIATRAEVTALGHEAGQWRVTTPQGLFNAPQVVNAAGAWADLVGQMASAEAIGLVPKRRTAMIVDVPAGMNLDHCPVTVAIDESFYVKPDAGRLLISPANEDPEVPSDVQPDEMDIAICIDRIDKAFDIKIRWIENRWAGLRSFVADKSPVAGYSDKTEGFYWLAGQGGYGIQSAPALARFAAAQLLGDAIPADILSQGLDPASLAPRRLKGTS